MRLVGKVLTNFSEFQGGMVGVNKRKENYFRDVGWVKSTSYHCITQHY